MHRIRVHASPPAAFTRISGALGLLLALAMGCGSEESSEESSECPVVVSTTLSMVVELPVEEEEDDEFYDVSKEGPLEILGSGYFRVADGAGAVSVTISGTEVPALTESTPVRLRVYSGYVDVANTATSTETQYVELVNTETDALLFAGMVGEPYTVEGARLQVSTNELCSSHEGGGGDDSAHSYRRAIVAIDGVEVVLEHDTKQTLPDLGLEVEHQGTVFEELYDLVEAESAIVVRPVP